MPDGALAPLVAGIDNKAGITSRVRRLVRLGAQALTDFAAFSSPQQPLALLLAVPERQPFHPPLDEAVFLNLLEHQSGVSLDVYASALFPFGRAGIFYALQQAFALIEAAPHRCVLIGGIDSGWDPRTLNYLQQQGRLKTQAGETDSFCPGEAAGFILLAKSEQGTHCILRPGLADEPGHRYSEEPYRGDGLSKACAAALSQIDQPVTQLVSSLNGESFGAKELGVAQIRNSAKLVLGQHWHPADCLGDCGAAYGPIALCLASAQPVATICYGSADHQQRGAAVVIPRNKLN